MTRLRFRWTSHAWAPPSRSCVWSPGGATRSPASRSARSSSTTEATPDGKAIVYSTDSEHKQEDPAGTQGFVEFFKDPDLVIFDAMYSLADATSVKEDWGHSSNIVGVELCQMARAKHLCLFHHEPIFDDAKLTTVLRETRRLEEITRGHHRPEISAAYDGMEIAV